MKIDIGLIGGYGLLDSFPILETINHETKYGKPSSKIKIFKAGKLKVGVISRHDEKHTIPPHGINFRANIQALKDLGAKKIITVSAVGSLKNDYKPGQLVVTDQFIDFTKHRKNTFFDEPTVHHVSVHPPFCEDMRKLAIKTLKKLKISHKSSGTYVCIEGPRFSTRAESNMFSNFADIVGMTLCPETALAREAELCCINIAMVTDYDVWKEHTVSTQMVLKTVKENEEKIKSFLRQFLKDLEIEDCRCNHSLEGTRMTKD